jgi:hypothetical protein
MKHVTTNFKPVPRINYARIKFTLILLALLSLGYYVNADDTSCHTAIEVQQATIDSLQSQLATVKSIPYNQGYQAGYKQATIDANPIYKQTLQTLGLIFIALIIAVSILAYSYSKQKPNLTN